MGLPIRLLITLCKRKCINTLINVQSLCSSWPADPTRFRVSWSELVVSHVAMSPDNLDQSAEKQHENASVLWT